MRLLDLFCGAGGAAVGYARSGFEVVGVDHVRQARYPFPFVQADAFEYLDAGGWWGFDAIHASPPCQAYSTMRHLPWVRNLPAWDSIPPTLERLVGLGVPWVLENVERAPLDGVTLCGAMFGLRTPDDRPVYRHRRFASSLFLLAPGHPDHYEVLVAGRATLAERGELVSDRASFGVPWMTRAEARQAIPPAYTEWIGGRLVESLRSAA